MLAPWLRRRLRWKRAERGSRGSGGSLRDPRRETAGAPREPPGSSAGMPGAAPRGECPVRPAPRRGSGVRALPREGGERPARAASPAPVPPRGRGRRRTGAPDSSLPRVPPSGPAASLASVQKVIVFRQNGCAGARRSFAMLKKETQNKNQVLFKRVSAMYGSPV